MRAFCTRYIRLILVLILTVQAVCLCCVFSACTSADAVESSDSAVQSAALSAAPAPDAQGLSPRGSTGIVTRGEWLRELLRCTRREGDDPVPDYPLAIFRAAYEEGVIDSADGEPFEPLTRAYVAHTLMRALHYEPVTVIPVADEDADDDMLTLVYYGCFVPDETNRVYPDAAVTEEEFSALTTELSRYAALRGKRIISFGDSIMFGVGNKGEGITDMIADKYGMTCADYSMCRATVGVNGDVSHIPDQIREAAIEGETADLILLNGGTNDMLHVPLGESGAGFSPFDFDEATYSGGLETCYALIRQRWGDVPVLFIRAHNMDICDDEVERIYGECAREISDKWSVPVADIYQDTGFNTEDPAIRDRFTFYKEQISRTDSIHPTASGYAKYYLPSVCALIADLLA